MFLFECFLSLDLSLSLLSQGDAEVLVECCDDHEDSCDNNSRDEKELNKSNDVSESDSEKLGNSQYTHIQVQGELARI